MRGSPLVLQQEARNKVGQSFPVRTWAQGVLFSLNVIDIPHKYLVSRVHGMFCACQKGLGYLHGEQDFHVEYRGWTDVVRHYFTGRGVGGYI